ncbi:peptidylprolyl isomerase [Tistrella mobilis]|jgi:peptidyl-prolyl cis-trans isomerase SurA
MKPLRILLLAAFAGTTALGGVAATGPGTALAQTAGRVAAVVNDDIVSVFDLTARMDMVIRTSQLPDDQQTRQRLAPQILRQLIDERLQLQAARRLGLNVSADELSRAEAQIETRNNFAPGTLEQGLRAQGIVPSTVIDRLRSEIAWEKVVAREVRPRIVVGEDEINAVLDRIRANAGQTEYRVLEIVLSVPDPQREAEVRQNAERLLEQLKAGAPFTALAREFSDGVTAQQSGDVGWVLPGQLAPEIDAFLANAQAGTVSTPIRTPEGYHIVAVADTRKVTGGDASQIEMALKQIALETGDDPAAQRAASERLQAATADLSSCEAVEGIATELGADPTTDLGRLKVGDLAPALRQAVINLGSGEVSAPITGGGMVRVLVVCDRSGDIAGLPDRDTIREALIRQRLDTMAQRHLHDLRRQAFIDVRV